MKTINKSVVTSFVAVAFTGFGLATDANAYPGEPKVAPESSIEQCVARIAENADYRDAGRVLHTVESEERRAGGHAISIDTQVFDVESGVLVREYATFCAVTDNNETRNFKLKEKSS